jgi:hypothetical protein
VYSDLIHWDEAISGSQCLPEDVFAGGLRTRKYHCRKEVTAMAQLALNPGVASAYGAAAHHVQQRGHEAAATLFVAMGRIRRLLEPGDPVPRFESVCMENARMSREMYRL